MVSTVVPLMPFLPEETVDSAPEGTRWCRSNPEQSRLSVPSPGRQSPCRGEKESGMLQANTSFGLWHKVHKAEK
jgi:hypothetical protein